MRFIDDMIKGIPLDEMTGEGFMQQNPPEALSVIPDVPFFADSPAPAAFAPPRETEISPVQNEEVRNITPRKKTRVRSPFGAILAASLALVIGVGGTMAYFGIVKSSGPLAALGSSETKADDPADKAAAELQTLLKDPEALAERIFNALNDWTHLKIAVGKVREIDNYKSGCIIDLSNMTKKQATLIKELEDPISDMDLPSLTEEEKAYFTKRPRLKLPGTGTLAFYISDSYTLIAVEWKPDDPTHIAYFPAEAASKLALRDLGDFTPFTEIDRSFSSTPDKLHAWFKDFYE